MMSDRVENDARKPRPRVLVCADTESLTNPAMLGVEDENLVEQPWVLPCATSEEARGLVAGDIAPFVEAWVYSADDMDGVNLAAGLKAIAPELRVILVAFEASGSLVSRCGAANLVPCIGQRAFLEMLRVAKRRYGSVSRADAATSASERFEGRLLHGKHAQHADAGEEVSPGSFDTVPIKVVPVAGTARHASRDLVPEQVAHDVTRENGAFVLSVMSGSGGTGKSTVSVLCSLLAQQAGRRVLVVDADLQFGDVAFLVGKKTALNMVDLLEHPERAQELVVEGSPLALLSRPGNLEHSELVESSMRRLLAITKPLFDVIVINTACAWSEVQVDLVELSDRVLFLLDQRPSSVRACSHALDYCIRCGLPMRQFVFALNRCGKQALLSSLDVSCALKGARVHELKDGGNEVSELLGAGLASELASSGNPLCESLRAVLGEILPNTSLDKAIRVVAPQGRKGRFRRKQRPKERVACL